MHRKLADGDIYFVDNRNERDETVDASFRMTGKARNCWHAETGEMEAASYTIANGRTTVPLHLEPWGTVFVVFRKATSETSHTVPQKKETQLATVKGPWTVAFQPGRGAPPSISMDNLASWSDSQDTGVKYFSGVGTYTTTLQAQPDWFKPGAKLWIDLGDVKNIAEVTVNGKPLGIVWHAPFRVDATGALKPGANQVTIKVTNLGQSVDRRSTTRRYDKIYVRRCEAVQGKIAIVAIRLDRAGRDFCCVHKITPHTSAAWATNGPRLAEAAFVSRCASLLYDSQGNSKLVVGYGNYIKANQPGTTVETLSMIR